MASSYDDYLNRLRKKRATSPMMSTAQSQVGIIGGNLANMQKQLERNLRRADAPLVAQTEALKEAQMSGAKLISNIYQSTSEADMQRRSAINQDIERAEFAKAQEEEAKRKAKEERKYGLIKTGAQVLGGIVGGIATKGTQQGIMTGAQIGGGLADVGIGATQKDQEERLSQGIIDATGGILSQVQVSRQRDFMKGAGDFFSSDTYRGLDLTQKKQLLMNYEQAIMTGDYDLFQPTYRQSL